MAVLCARVDEPVRPLALERLDEAFYLAVGARPVRLRSQVPDPAGGEQLAQRAVLRVAPSVVAHQPLRAHAVLGVESERTLAEAGDGLRLRVGQHLGVGEPGVVVDDGVHDVVADLAPFLLRRASAVAGDRVPRLGEAGERRPVDVQEVPGTGPLVAARRLAPLRLRPRAATAPERLPDGRVWVAEPGGDRARPVPGAAPLGADSRLLLGAQHPGRALGPARAIDETGERPPLLLACRPPAARPSA